MVSAFADTMKYNTTLDRLYLSRVGATDGYLELGNALRENKQNALTSLNLSRNPMRDKGAIGLSPGLASLQHLTALNLSACGIQPKVSSHNANRLNHQKGIAALMKSLESNPNSPSLGKSSADACPSLKFN